MLVRPSHHNQSKKHRDHHAHPAEDENTKWPATWTKDKDSHWVDNRKDRVYDEPENGVAWGYDSNDADASSNTRRNESSGWTQSKYWAARRTTQPAEPPAPVRAQAKATSKTSGNSAKDKQMHHHDEHCWGKNKGTWWTSNGDQPHDGGEHSWGSSRATGSGDPEADRRRGRPDPGRRRLGPGPQRRDSAAGRGQLRLAASPARGG